MSKIRAAIAAHYKREFAVKTFPLPFSFALKRQNSADESCGKKHLQKIVGAKKKAEGGFGFTIAEISPVFVAFSAALLFLQIRRQ